MNKQIGFSLFFISVATVALSMAGCGTSSTGSSTAGTVTTTGTTGYTTCTTAVSGQAAECMPGLGTYGDTIVYTGMADISNVNVAGNFIHSIVGMNDNIVASSLNYAWITVTLNATENGPDINATIQFPYAEDSYGAASQVFAGYDTWLPQNPNETNDIGSILMNPAALSTSTSLELTSFQDWDGQYPTMSGVSVILNGTNVGSVGLTQQYSQE